MSRHTYTIEEDIEIIESKLTDQELANKYNITVRGVQDRRSRLKSKMKDKSCDNVKIKILRNTFKKDGTKKQQVPFSEEEDRDILAKKIPDKEIAKKYGRNVQGIYDRRCKLKALMREQEIPQHLLQLQSKEQILNQTEEQKDTQLTCAFCKKTIILPKDYIKDIKGCICPECQKLTIKNCQGWYIYADAQENDAVSEDCCIVRYDNFEDFYSNEVLENLSFSEDYMQKYDCTVYTYCSFNNDNATGCCSYLIIDHDTKTLTKFGKAYADTTHHRLDLMSAINALDKIQEGKKIIIYSNSNYIMKVRDGEWNTDTNQMFWRKLENLIEKRTVTFAWNKYFKTDIFHSQLMTVCDDVMNNDTEKELVQDLLFCPKQKNAAHDEEQHIMNLRIIMNYKGEYRERPSNIKIKDYADVYEIFPKCASSIDEFRKNKYHSLEDYKKLSTHGIDGVDAKNKEYFLNFYSKDVFDAVEQNIDDEDVQLEAIKWHFRGLSMEDAIRKALIDNAGKEG